MRFPPIKYRFSGAPFNIAPFRKQDLVSSFGALNFDSKHISVRVGNLMLSKKEAIGFKETSAGCFQLTLDCRKFSMDADSLNFTVEILYKGQLKLTYDFVLLYPKGDALFDLTHRISDITWDKKVEIGTIVINPSNSNKGDAWWQYIQRKYFLLKYTSCIHIDGASRVTIGGEEFLSVTLNPRERKVIKIFYIGNGQSICNTQLINLEYGIDKCSSRVSFSVKPLSQDLELSLQRIISVVNHTKDEKCFILRTNNRHACAPDAEITKVYSNSELFKVKDDAANGVYDIYVRTSSIVDFPIESKVSLIVESKRCGTKRQTLSIVSERTPNENAIKFVPESIFKIHDRNLSVYETDLCKGIDIEISNDSNLNINDAVVRIEKGDFGFQSGNSKSVRIGKVYSGRSSIVSLIPSKTKISHSTIDLRVSIPNSDFTQLLHVGVRVIPMIKALPVFFIKKCFSENRELQVDDILFDLLVTNKCQANQDKRHTSAIELSQIRVSHPFQLKIPDGKTLLKAGDSMELKCTLNKVPEIPYSLDLHVRYLDTTYLACKVHIIRREFIRSICKGINGLSIGGGKDHRFIFPDKKEDIIQIEKWIFSRKEECLQNTPSDIYIELPQSSRFYEIETDGFYFNDRNKCFDVQEGTVGIYIDPSAIWGDKKNIESDEVIWCNYLVKDSAGNVIERKKRRFVFVPRKTTPKMEVSIGDKLIYPSDGMSAIIDLGVVTYHDSILQKGARTVLGSFLIHNNQTIPVPKRAGELTLSIIDVLPSPKKRDNPKYNKVDLSRLIELSSSQIKLCNGEMQSVDILLNWMEVATIIRKCGIPLVRCVRISIEEKGKPIHYVELKFILKENREENWYALDLGTTGIVVAKRNNDGEIVPVEINKIDDFTENNGQSEELLETSPEIISSIMGLHSTKDSNCAKILLEKSKESVEFSKAILPAAKFIVGQDTIPHAYKYINSYSEYSLFGNERESIEALQPDTLISKLYQHILSHLGNSVSEDSLERLTLTYPNTYTGEQINKIISLISTIYPRLKGFVNAVPESDAALAHYLMLRGNKQSFEKEDETILVFDMGAGTLDISVVTLHVDTKSQKALAVIDRKIGIPVAGNYLNVVLYESLKDSLGENPQWNGTGKILAFEKLKRDFSNPGFCDVLLPYNFKGEAQKGESLLNSVHLKTYLKYCTHRVFEVLFNDLDNWSSKIDTFVFSGRASRFFPLREAIKDIFRVSSGDSDDTRSIIDDSTIVDTELKKSVAIGAIEYTKSFSSEIKTNRFQIVSHNQYNNVYMIYVSYGDMMNNVVKAEKLIEPASADWDDVPVVNGTKSLSLSGSARISINPSCKYILFVQSLLTKEEIETLFTKVWLRKENLSIIDDDCFVNEIIGIPINELGTDLENVLVEFEVDENNNIGVKINNIIYTGERLRENIETNRYYNANALLSERDE